MHNSQFKKIDPYDWFCAPGSHVSLLFLQPSPVEDKPRAKAADVSLPISLEQWAQFQCPEELRQAFLSDAGPYSINSTSISAQVSRASLVSQVI